MKYYSSDDYLFSVESIGDKYILTVVDAERQFDELKYSFKTEAGYMKEILSYCEISAKDFERGAK